MIVARVTDSLLRRAIVSARHPEEEVVWDPRLVEEALHLGFPRLLVRSDGLEGEARPEALAVLDLDPALLGRWAAEWRCAEVPGTW
jgi:hypothetical protein